MYVFYRIYNIYNMTFIFNKMYPIPKKVCIFSSKGKSLSFNSIAKDGIIDQPVLRLLLLNTATENEESPSENPVTQLGERVLISNFLFTL